MRPHPNRRHRRLSMIAPAAIVGTVAAGLTAVAPAAAAEPTRQTGPHAGALLTAAPTVAKTATATATTVRATEAMLAAARRASAVPTTHTVQAGETVSGIAQRYGLRTADVLAWNGLERSSIIYPGQVLQLVPAASTASAPAPATPSHAASMTASYAVQRGDTLSGIAARHGVSLDALFAANGMGYSTVIFPGQTIAIPAAANAVAAAAPAARAPAAPAPVPVAGYTVHSGDTLSGIAARHGVSLDALFAANGLGWASIIYPGQSLTIPATATPAVAAAAIAGLDAEQTANARLIVQIGRELGVPDRGIAIALATAMVESWLRNLDWGDRDSLGLFQQRPSTGWGTPAEIMDPARSIRVFYGGAADPNGSRTRGLLDIPGWQSMGFSQAAQSVQISAFPDRYGQWEQAAYDWLAALG